MTAPRQHYFDNNATTQIAPEVVEAMLPFLTELWGNPSGPNRFGREVSRHIEEARAKVAALVNAEPSEIVFTSCGTESNNSALHSALSAAPGRKHVITTAVEHSANISFCEQLETRGIEVTYLPVRADGSLELPLLEQAIRPDTAIVSVMWANNETGVAFPIDEIAAFCRRQGVVFHTDAVQAPGRLKIDVTRAAVDMLSLSAHKFHAPKGIGVLYVRLGTKFHPYIVGGHQEHGRRGGTESAAQIVAAGRAAELAIDSLDEMNTRVRALRDRLEATILRTIPNTERNGAAEPRLPNTSNITFRDIESEAALVMLDQAGICASSGSACTTGSIAPSHVLTAMSLNPTCARASLRLSLGIYSSAEDVDHLLGRLPGIIARLRAMPR